MNDFLDYAFNQKALLASTIIGFANGYLSGYVVLRRDALKIGSLSHALLPGIAIAVLLVGLSALSAFLGALIAALLIGLGSLGVSRGARIDSDTALAILYTTAFSVGLIALNFVTERVDIEDWLFGNILGLADSDLWVAFGVSAAVLTALIAFQRPLLLTLFEPDVAATQGVPVRAMHHLLLGLVILALITSFQAVGCILSIGLLVTPAATIYQFANNPRALFWGGGLLGALCGSTAVALSWLFNIPTGSAIVLLLGTLFFAAYIFSPRYGLLSKRRRPDAPGQ